MLRLLVVTSALALVTATACLADVPPPGRGERREQPVNVMPLEVRPISPREPARLEIPLHMMGPDGEPGAAPGAPAGAEGQARTRTLISGLALALAAMAGGLWMVRRRDPLRPGAMTVLAILAVGSLGMAAGANIAPMPRPLGAPGSVNVELVGVPDSRSIILKISPEQFAKLQKQMNPRAGSKSPK